MTPLDPVIVDVLEHWDAVAAHSVDNGLLLPNHCILACKILVVTLNNLGFNPVSQPVQTLVTNKAARALIADKVPHEQWPEFAWSVGTDRQPGMTGYPGHLILTVGDHLIDPTARQFQRPNRLRLPDIVITDATDFHATGHTAATGPDGTTIQWWADPTLGNLHRTSNDWKRNWRIWHHQLTVAQRATKKPVETPKTDPKRSNRTPKRSKPMNTHNNLSPADGGKGQQIMSNTPKPPIVAEARPETPAPVRKVNANPPLGVGSLEYVGMRPRG